ncbi:nicotinate-nucleotide adenylyltransferase [Stenoxybacter acetivorans]|uniref:nicotinate-nucleotide adenylyltransferase n=1 Tax=Stenoxybacter acetivorans TaxID=422441 RepID=UPI00056C17F9|nr:nicotinate-nucleotide adenylyltransferase [Stenoxybacter acetivorans]
MNRIGLFGGTFDPIHNGHLHIARAFAAELALDEVIVIPAGQPYHKTQRTYATADQRLDMVQLAIQSDTLFSASDYDLVHSGNTYTINTVSAFNKVFKKAQLWWLLGMDSFAQIHTWHRFHTLLNQVNIAVASRGNQETHQINSLVSAWQTTALHKMQNHPEGNNGGRFYALNAPFLPISSTDIRHQCQSGNIAAVQNKLPDAVVNYIIRHGLYLN